MGSTNEIIFILDSLDIFIDSSDKRSDRDVIKRPTINIALDRVAMEASCECASIPRPLYENNGEVRSALLSYLRLGTELDPQHRGIIYIATCSDSQPY